MSQEYRVIKNKVDVQVTLVGQNPFQLTLFLAAQARSHAGHERIIDVLNGKELFLPAINASGNLCLIRRDAVVMVSVPYERDGEGADEEAEEGSLPPVRRATVEVVLDGGTTVRGLIEYSMPEGRRRLVDYLNLDDGFLSVRHDGTIYHVNRHHIARVDELKEPFLVSG